MGRTDEMMDLFIQTTQRSKEGMERLKRWLKDRLAEGGLTPEEIAKFRDEIDEIAKAEKDIDKLERLLNEKDPA